MLELGEQSAEISAKEFVGRTFIDGTFGEVEDIVVRDRKHLSYDGVVVPIVAINLDLGQHRARARDSLHEASFMRMTARI